MYHEKISAENWKNQNNIFFNLNFFREILFTSYYNIAVGLLSKIHFHGTLRNKIFLISKNEKLMMFYISNVSYFH